MAAEEAKRVNVIFTPEQYDTLQKIADKQKISISDALRQAIKISKLVVDANEDPDAKILIEKGNRVQELKLVR